MYKIRSQLQSSRRHFQSSCIAGLCVILRKTLEKISIFEKYSELMLRASFTLLNHLKPCHTNIAMWPCWWSRRSQGQTISPLHYYSVCAYKQAQLKWYPNKQNRTKRLQEKNNRSCSLHSWSVLNVVIVLQGYFKMWQIKIKNIFPCIASSKKSTDSSSASKNALCSYTIPNKRFLKPRTKLLNSVLQGTWNTWFPDHCSLRPLFSQYIPPTEPITTSSVAPTGTSACVCFTVKFLRVMFSFTNVISHAERQTDSHRLDLQEPWRSWHLLGTHSFFPTIKDFQKLPSLLLTSLTRAPCGAPCAASVCAERDLRWAVRSQPSWCWQCFVLAAKWGSAELLP